MWRSDGSNLIAIAGATVSFIGASSGNKGNALLDRGGSGIFNFSIDGPGAWVGVSTASHFKPSWALKGLLYGGPGNLADGSALVAGRWGPICERGDTLSMRVEQTPTTASVAFARNGEGLGVAFDIAGWNGGALHPVVSLGDAGEAVTLLSVGELAPIGGFLRAAPSAPGIAGDWTNGRYALLVDGAGAGAWSVAAKVANSLHVRASARADGRVGADGPVAATRMMPPPELAALENEVAAALGAMTDLRRDGDELVLEAAGRAPERFRRADGPGPARKEDIHWMNA